MSNAFATGFLWGLTGSVILVAADPVYVLFTVFLLGGMMTGGIVVNSAYLPAMYLFLCPTILPAIAALIVARSPLHFQMAGMVTIFTIVLVLAGRSINRSILNNVRLRVGQILLTDRLRASEMAMAQVQKIAQVGGLEITAGGERIICTDETLQIIGADRDTFKPTFQTLLERIHPEDRAMVAKAFGVFLGNGKKEELGCRIVMDSGEVKYLHLVGQIIEKSLSGPARFFATVQDVTVRKLEEDRLKFANLLLYTQMEASPDGILIVDRNRRDHLIEPPLRTDLEDLGRGYGRGCG